VAIGDYAIPQGLMGRSTVHNDTPGQIRYQSYITSAGVETNEPQVLVRLYNSLAAAASTVKGGAYQVIYTGAGLNPGILLPAAVTANVNIVIAPAIYLTATWGWYVWAGYVDALVEGATDVAIGDFLKVTAPNAYLITDGATRTTDSFAVACEAQASATPTLAKVFLFGAEADVD
jgi:hypothetical protein